MKRITLLMISGFFSLYQLVAFAQPLIGSGGEIDPLETESGELRHGDEESATQQFGLADQFVHTIQAYDCLPASNLTAYNLGGSEGRINITGGSGFFGCGLTLPTGVRITRFELEACDSSVTAQVRAVLYRYPRATQNLTTIASVGTGVADAPGCVYRSVSVDHTVENFLGGYLIDLFDPDPSNATNFRAARVYWRRQISPPPGAATFFDVPPWHPFFNAVEALAASGITTGCGGGFYCPDNPVTRGQMAAFLARAMGLHWPF
jgi:hypothetical protein